VFLDILEVQKSNKTFKRRRVSNPIILLCFRQFGGICWTR